MRRSKDERILKQFKRFILIFNMDDFYSQIKFILYSKIELMNYKVEIEILRQKLFYLLFYLYENFSNLWGFGVLGVSFNSVICSL